MRNQIGFGIWWDGIGEWDYADGKTLFFGSKEDAGKYLEGKDYRRRAEVREVDFSKLPPPIGRRFCCECGQPIK